MGSDPVPRRGCTPVFLFAIVVFRLLVVSQGNVGDTYEFEQSIYRVVEGTNSSAEVYILRTGPHEVSNSTVDVATSDGTITGRSAIAGTDYTAVLTTVAFLTAGDNRVAVSIPITDNPTDNVDEDIHCFTLTLSLPDPSDGILGSPALVCIIDNNNDFMGTCPPPEATIESNGEPVVEVNTGSTMATVSWTDPTPGAGVLDMTYQCFSGTSTDIKPCVNPANLPISTTFSDYNGRILVQYAAFTQFSPTVESRDCDFYIRVRDNEPPMITCPTNAANTTEPGLPTGPVYFPDAISTDGSLQAVTLSSNATSGMAFSIGETIVEFVATDTSGNSNSCTFSITITDDEEPVIECPDNIEVNADEGENYATVTWLMSNVTDNSNEPLTPMPSHPSGSQFSFGFTTVTVNAADSSSNTANCSFTVNVLDLEAPNITCQDNMTVSTDPGLNVATFTLPALTSVSDNSGMFPTINVDVNGNTFSVGQNVTLDLATGQHRLQYTAVDNAMNNATCDVYITVNDNEPPMITCPPNENNTTEPGSATRHVYFPNATSDDNSMQAVTLSSNATSGDAFTIGETIVEFVATDTSGNSNSCTFSITITDDEEPVIECPEDIEVNADDGENYATVTWLISNVTDNSQESLTPNPSHPSGSRFLLGPTTVTVNATDSSSNTGNCSFTVNVLDLEAPNITCPDNMTVSTDPGLNVATFTLPYPMSVFDNSGMFTINIDVNGTTHSVGQNVSLDLATGQHRLQYTAVDNAMNNATCDVYITVNDNEPPMITCPTDETNTTEPGLPTGPVYFPDATSDDNSMQAVTLSSNATSGMPFTIGETIVEFVATDTSGNSNSCTFSVTITDDEDPVLICPSDMNVTSDEGEVYATVSWQTNVTDNSQESITPMPSHPSGSQFPFGPTTVTVNATDSSSNTGNCSFIVNVLDLEAPNITCPDNMTVSTDPGLNVATFTLPDPVSVFDNSRMTTIIIDVNGTSRSVGDNVILDLATGQHLLEYTVVDNSMNNAMCNVYITVNDTENPDIMCPDSFTVGTDPGLATASAIWESVNVTDNSMLPIMPVSDFVVGSPLSIGAHTVQYNATDASGNTATCSFTVTVQDMELPTIENCSALTFYTSPGLPTAFVSNIEPDATDNQEIMSTLCLGVTSGVGVVLGIGTYTFNCVATDTSAAGLQSACVRTIIVEDNETPNITCPMNETLNTQNGQDYAVLTLPDAASAVDNSGSFTLSIDVAGNSYSVGQSVNFSLSASPHLVQYTATDNSTNNETCDMYIIVIDDEPPIVTCPSNGTNTTDPGLPTGIVYFPLAMVTDNSGESLMPEANVTSGSSFPIGDSVVLFTAEDRSGNEGSCTFVVIVTDDEEPVIECPENIEVNADEGENYATVTWLMSNVTDNSQESLTAIPSHPSGSRFPFGPTTVTVNATDSSSNTGTCSFIVNVLDFEAPNITCPDNMTVSTDPGLNVATFTLPYPMSVFDNSGMFTINIDVNGTTRSVGQNVSLDLATGQHRLQYSVVDNSMNNATCDVYITVNDTENPVITCPDSFTVGTDPGVATASVTWESVNVTDNSMLPIVPVSDSVVGSPLSIGVHTVQYNATDASGNTATCSFTVTVEDMELPTIENCSVLTFYTSPGLPTAFVSNIEPDATDNHGIMLVNCVGVTTLGGVVRSIGSYEFNCVATDTSEGMLRSACTRTIIVEDNETPNITCPMNETLYTQNGQDYAVFTLLDAASAVDNSGSFTISIDVAGNSYSVGQSVNFSLSASPHLVQYTATDNSTNNETCDMYITVIDDEPPIVTCPSNGTNNTDPGLPTGIVYFPLAMVTDNSGEGLIPVANESSGSSFPIGDSVVLFTAMDSSGNEGSCTFVVTVADDEEPVIECPENIEVNADEGENYATVTWLMSNVTDNSQESLTAIPSHPSGSRFPFGPTTVTVNATDSSSNTGTCSFIVNVLDFEAPNITCPDNMTVSTDPGLNVATFTLPYPMSVFDNSGMFTINIDVNGTTRSVGQNVSLDLATGQHRLQYSVVDNSMNNATCDVYITVNDTENPVITCPDSFTVGTDPGVATASVTWESVNVTDNSMLPIVPVSDFVVGSPLSVGVHMVQYNATDASGNTATCFFTVTVEDMELPTIENCSALTFHTSPGLPTAFVSNIEPDATDNHGISSVNCTGVTSEGGVELGIGMHTFICIATDTGDEGLQSACNRTIVVEDNETPNITCPMNDTLNTQNGQDYAVFPLPEPASAVDNSGSFTISIDVAGNSYSVGQSVNFSLSASPHLVQYTATDNSTNNETCDMYVTVIDGEPPTVTCPSNGTNNTDPGLPTGMVYFPLAMVTDNSGESPLPVANVPSGSSFPIGDSVVLFTAVDSSGNEGNCTFVVTVTDDEEPMIECPDNIEVNADDGENYATVTWLTPNVTDNSNETLTPMASPPSGSRFLFGPTTVTVNATDSSSNTGTCSFIVNVLDLEAPNITCPDNMTVSTDPGLNVATFTLPDPMSVFDNSGMFTINIDVNGTTHSVGQNVSLDLATGQHRLQYTVVDNSMNNATCDVYITVIDTEDPVITCPDDFTVGTDPGLVTANATWESVNVTDNSMLPIMPVSDSVVGSPLSVGAHMVQYNATDASGNTATCSFTVTVQDMEFPIIENCSALTFYTSPGLPTAFVSNIEPDATDNHGISSVNCTGVTSEGGVELGIGMHTFICTATDTSDEGLQSACNRTIVVEDDETPNITCPMNKTLNTQNGQDYAVFTLLDAASAVDNSGSFTLSIDVAGNSYSVGQSVNFSLSASPHLVQYTATDNSTNNETCDMFVTVIDGEPPTVTCPSNRTNNTDHGLPTGVVYFPLAMVTDNSGENPVPEANVPSGSPFPIGDSVVLFTAVDDDGNEGNCTFLVTVTDNEEPVIECPEDMEVNTDEGENYATVTWLISNVTDNSQESLTPNPSHPSGSRFLLGPTTVTVNATDFSSNTGNCSFTVNVFDLEAPNITCPDNMTVSTDSGLNMATFTLPPLWVFDNSGMFTINIDINGTTYSVGQNVSLDLATGQHLLEYTVVDNSTNNATCVVYITVNDLEDPVITCPDSFTVGTDPGLVTASATWESVNVTDNSMLPVVPVSDFVVGSPLSIGVHTVQYNATDGSGNTATCSFNVTVEDMEPPRLGNCSALTFYTSPGLPTAVVSNTDVVPDATDNQGIDSVICLYQGSNIATGVVLGIGTYNLTCVARDTSAAGLQSSCFRIIIVEDYETPNITCPNNRTLRTLNGQDYAVFTLPNASSAVDNSGSFIISIDVAGNSYSVGQSVNFSLSASPHLVQYTATDKSTYNETCDMFVTVIDGEPPTVTCPSNRTNNTDPGLPTGMVYFPLAMVTDNSGENPVPEANVPSGSPFPIGDSVVLFTAVDDDGNEGNCTFLVTVTDNEEPVIECPEDMEVNTDEGENYATVTWLISNVTDNSQESLTPNPSHPSGSRFLLGPTTVTVNATDFSSNTGNCSFTVNVFDLEAPNITCPDNMTVSTDSDLNMATFTLPPLWVFDNSGMFTINIDINGTIYSVGQNVSLDLATGQHLLEYTVVDNSTNNATCVVYITVNDIEDPVITCLDSFTVGTDPGLVTASATWESVNVTDNSMLPVVPVSDFVVGSPLSIGVHTVQYNATDGSGNTATCSFNVTVEDMEPPRLGNCSALTFYTSPGLPTAVVSNTDVVPDATDNQGIDSVICLYQGTNIATGVVLGIGTYNLTCVARDTSAAGLQSSCFRIIIVEENETPNITCPANRTLNTLNGKDYAVFTLPHASSAVDNSGSFTISIDVAGNSYNVGQSVNFSLSASPHLVQYTATDNSTNNETCDMFVTVVDTEDPVITCPDSFTVGTDPGVATASATWESVNVTDNSMLPIMPVSDFVVGSPLSIGVHTVQYNATDASGNTATCFFTVTVEDMELPTIENCSALTFYTSPGLPTAFVSNIEPDATDNHGIMSVTCLNISSSGGVVRNTGTYNFTCIARDFTHLQAACVRTVNVEDNETPNITCPMNETRNTLNGQDYAVFTLLEPASAVDNSGSFTISIDVAGNSYSVGQSVNFSLSASPHLVEYTATDNSTNNETCDMFVTVIDGEPPTVECPSNTQNNTDPGLPTGMVYFPLATVTDNSGENPVPVANVSSGSSFPIGESVVLFTAKDSSGNEGSCTFVVTIIDDEPPQVQCPGDIMQNTDPGQNYSTVTWSQVNATDNSGEPVTLVESPPAGSQFSIGVHTVDIDATDSSGRRASCDFTVNITDNETPNITCPMNETFIALNGQDYAVFSLPDLASAVDNSGSFTVSIDVAGNSYSVSQSVNFSLSASPHLVQYTAIDSATNSETCDMYITVIDEEDPVLTCPDNQLVVVPDGQLTAAVTWPPPQVTDNSGEDLNAIPSHDNGTVFDIGDGTTVFYNATDSSGNTGYCNFTVMVIDNVPPMITCPTVAPQPTALNERFGPVFWDDPIISDNVPTSVTVWSSHVNGSNFDLGDTTVTLVATDAAGNNNSCTFVVTVADMEPPVINGCPEDFNVTTQPGQSYGVPMFTEPTAQDNAGSVTIAGLGRSGEQFSIGPTTVVYVALDEVGLSSVCRFTLLVIDEESPMLQEGSQCPTDIVVFIEDINADNMTVTWTDPAFQDNSNNTLTVTVTPLENGSPFPAGNTTVNITVSDVAGNEFVCSFVVTVNMYDRTPPTFSMCPPAVTVLMTDPGRDVASPIDFGLSVNDIGSGIDRSMLTVGEPFQIGDNIVSLYAVDLAGNVAHCNFTVTVNDMENPNITSCPSNQTILTQMDSPHGVPTWSMPTAQDNSDSVVINCTHRSGDSFGIGSTTVECTATDPSNNTDVCSFVITVIDMQVPEVTFCPSDINQGTDPGADTAVITFGQPTVSDNDGMPVTEAGPNRNNTAFSLGNTLLSFTFTDTSGNVAYCNFTVTVTDDELPTAGNTCPNDTLIFTSIGRSTAPAQWNSVIFTDNVMVVNTMASHNSGDEFPLGRTTVLLNATDAAGNIGICQFVVEVQDTEDPVFFLCPMAIRQPTDPGSPNANVSWIVPNVTDNSGIIASLEVTHSPGDSFSIGLHTVVYTAVDQDNNIGVCTFPITVLDNEDPVLNGCRDNVTLYVPSNSTKLFAAWPFPAASDNSGSFTIYNATYTEVSVTLGLTTVTVNWGLFTTVTQLKIGHYQCTIRVEDAAGNMAQCVTELWIKDVIDPVLEDCPPVLQPSYSTDYNLPTAVVSWIPVNVSDNSEGPLQIMASHSSGHAFSIGETPVTISATDESGNMATCMFNVTVVDEQQPNVTCPGNLQANTILRSNYSIASWSPPTVFDNSGSYTLTCTVEIGDQILAGITEVWYNVTDEAGNTDSCHFTVYVTDNEDPFFDPCPASFNFPTDFQQSTANVSWELPVPMDNVGVQDYSFNYLPGSLLPIGDTEVEYNVTDTSGNKGSCVFVVTVEDREPPTITCPDAVLPRDTDPQRNTANVTFVALADDNSGEPSVSCSPPSGTDFQLSATNVRCTATDAFSLETSCQFIVLVSDNEPPEIECSTDITVSVFTHQGGKNVEFPDANATDFASGFDRLSCTRQSGEFFIIGSNDITCTARDLANNVNTCTFRVIVNGIDDTEPPVISNCPANITQSADNITVTPIVSWTPPNVTDNSGEAVTLTATIDPGSPFGVGVTLVIYTATDAATLTSTCVFFVIVLDVDSPDILQCPANIIRPTDPGMDSAVVDWTSPSARDNSGSVDFTGSATPGQLFDLGVTVVTYTAVDSDNNVERCSFTISVVDMEKPVITGCPTMELIHDTEPGQNYSIVTWEGITISDNSGNWTVSNSGPTQGPIDVGTHQVAIIAEDANGNTEVCNFTVRVRDMEHPQFVNCPGEIMKLVNESGRDAVATWDALQVTDNVAVDFSTLSGSHLSGQTFSYGSTRVTFSVDDVNGNTNDCTFNVTISDAPLAVSNCPVYIREPTAPGQPDAVVTWDTPDVEPVGTSADTSSSPYRSGNTIPIGTHTITYTVTALTSASCSFVVEVYDNEPPTWNNCPSVIMPVTPAAGANFAAVSWTPPTASDNSGMVTVSPGSYSPGSVFPIDVTEVTYTAVDPAGHMITCSFDVTVLDNVDPVVTCPAGYSVFTDPGRGTATITWPDATATDNGNITSLVSSPPNGSPLTIGANMITYTATDGGQNTGDCPFSITVIDNEPPVFTDCPTEATAIAPTGQAMAVVQWMLPFASDNAITVTVQSFQTSGILYPLGVTPAMYRATDRAGNQANCTFDIIVYDQQIPVFSNCPENLTESTALGQAIAPGVMWTPPAAVDNDPQLMLSENNNPPADFPLGVTEVNYTATDRAGNTAVCVFTVTVTDMEDPTYSGCPGSFSMPADSGTTTANVPWTPPTPSDNVGAVSSTSNRSPNTTFSLGTTVVEYTVTDAAGNTGTCSFNVTVLDSNAPMLMNCPTEQSFCADQGTLSRAVSWIEPTATDAEGAVTRSSTHAPGDTFMHNSGTPTLVIYTATDESGLMATCSFNVIINDCEKPSIQNCSSAFNRLGDSGGSSTAVSWTEPTATDNSGQVVLNRTHAPGSTFTAAASPTTVRYDARDPSGNTATCSFTVTVTVDPGAPTIMGCPEDITQLVATGTAQASVTWTAPTVVPNTASLSPPSHAPGSNFNTGETVTVTYTATDSFSRSATCDFTVSVIADTANPVIQNCPSNIARTVSQDQTSLSVSWTPPTATDNSGRVTLNATHDPGFSFLIATTTVIYTASDPFGGSMTCTFTVTVTVSTDNIPPVISNCPTNMTRNNDPGLATAVVSWTEPTATDNQGTPTLTSDRSPGFAFPIGETTVTYTATDGNVNEQTCSFTITVIDNEDPTLSNCPQSFTLTVLQATGSVTATWTLPTAADNSGMVTLTTTMEPGQLLQPGQYPVTYTATDPAGRFVTCTFTVTVQISTGCDNTPCMNGGTCTPLLNNGFSCNCPSTWMGTTCELDVNECAQTAVIQECTNRGLVCINQLNGYTCDCPNGFFRAGNSDNCIRGRTFRVLIIIVEIFFQPSPFDPDLGNSLTVLFLSRQQRLQEVLIPVFSGLNGFAYVRVLLFSSGSIATEVLVTVDPTSTATQADVENALQQNIDAGDLIGGSEFKVSPSTSIVREEVCVSGYCQNGGTCTPTAVMYLSSCTCPAGFAGDRCQSEVGITTTAAPGGGLSTEAVVAIIVGAAVAIFAIILLVLCLCFAMTRQQRRGRRGYLYRDDYADYRKPQRRTNGSIYDVEFRPEGAINDGYHPHRQFAVPYVATGRETGIPLHEMLGRRDADYY